MLSCVLHEDEHLLVVNKPPGWSTHSPSPFAGEGIYEWLRRREPRWASLSILHRLDKETSGVLVFGKTRLANQSLAAQFEQREVHKSYRFLTRHPADFTERVVRSALVRVGDRYVARPVHAGAPVAETVLRFVRSSELGDEWEAEPRTGLTHQIRVHALEVGLPLVGDALYGSEPGRTGGRHRLCLHAARIRFQHPAGGEACFEAPAGSWDTDPLGLRRACVDAAETDSFRLIHGEADGRPGVYLDQMGHRLLLQADEGPGWSRPEAAALAERLRAAVGAQGVYLQALERRLSGKAPADLSPRALLGVPEDGPFEIRENGVRFELRFDAGYSVGLFLDQRDNRRRLLVNHIGPDFRVRDPGLSQAKVLNLFAYTCGFSVAAALAGASTTSVDLSRNYLEWGRRNFERNGQDPAQHAFLQGDAFDWLRRLARKGNCYEVVILDPPTFSRSKERGVFRASKDYGRLVEAALPVLAGGGVLLASVNTVDLDAAAFVAQVRSAVAAGGRRIVQDLYVPQPPDFPVSPGEPAHLKTVWCRVS